MSNLEESLPADELLAHVSWIRRLARNLVADHELAEELVQETCVVALERGPRDRSRLKGWLGSVMRNALRQHVRGEGRRRTRERSTARDEALESTARLVERVSIQRRLVDEVLGLHEPYRSAVLLRFFEERQPIEIAARLDVPVATVHSRLQRALALLRKRLDAGDAREGLDGDDRGWVLALAPLLVRPGSGGAGVAPSTLPSSASGMPNLLGVSLMQSNAIVLGVLGLAAGGLAAGAWVWSARSTDEPAGSQDAALPALASTTLLPGEAGQHDAPVSAQRVAVGSVLDPAAGGSGEPRDSSAPDAQLHTLRARVLDADADPVAGVEVRSQESDVVLGETGAGGWLEVRTAANKETLVVRDSRWVTVHTGVWRANAAYDPVVVIAPSIEVGGRVVNEEGVALAGVHVAHRLPADFRTRFSDVLDATHERSFGARTDADGRFAIPRAPAVEGAILRAQLDGYEVLERVQPPVSDYTLRIVLYRPGATVAGALRGRVVDDAGEPVPGARVAVGLASVVSDDGGEFVIDLDRAVTSDRITAMKAGFLPARRTRPSRPYEGETGWPDFVLLELGGPALELAGRVLDHEGRAVANARVWLADPTPTAPMGYVPMVLEGFLAGATVPRLATESLAAASAGGANAVDGDAFFDNVTSAGEPNAVWNWTATDGGGRFALAGLDDRAYRLNVMAPESLEIITTEPLRAGEADATIRLPRPDVHSRVAGVVRTRRGAPLAGVRVITLRPVVDITGRVFGGTGQVLVLERGAEASTDAAGRFELTDVPRDGVSLALRSDAILPTRVRLEDAGPVRQLEVIVDERCHLEVVADDEEYDEIGATDEKGRAVDLMMLSQGGIEAYDRVPLVRGRSGVVSLSTSATRLMLYAEGEVAKTVPLDLVAGRVNRVEM